MTRMHNPPHPGEVLRDGVFTDTGIRDRLCQAAWRHPRSLISRAEWQGGLGADMAVRFAAALGGSAASWLHMQANYDLWLAEKALKREVAKIEPLKQAA